MRTMSCKYISTIICMSSVAGSKFPKASLVPDLPTVQFLITYSTTGSIKLGRPWNKDTLQQ